METGGLFSHRIVQSQAASFEKGKGRQGIIPDILYRKPAKGGDPAREVLLDVKVLNEGSAGYETVANQAELENPTQCYQQESRKGRRRIPTQRQKDRYRLQL